MPAGAKQRAGKVEADTVSVPQLVSPPGDPLPNARRVIEERFRSEDGTPLLVYHRGSFHAYDGSSWPEVEEARLRAELYSYFEDAQYRVGDDLKPFQPNRAKLGNVIDALEAVAHLPERLDTPAWLGNSGPVPAHEVLALRNGLLHLPERRLLPHTPSFYVHHALPFDFEPNAPAARRWNQFLYEVWPDDAEAVRTLQEMFGYILSGDTSQQKAFVIVGPKRSGKGTLARVLVGLMGRHNVAGPTLAGLTTNFGLQPLIGKPLGIVSDARLSAARGNASALVERLLSITGEDTLTIDRKHREPWTGKLPTRFVILSNELPSFADSSGAIASRFIVLTMTRSFYGNEDPALTDTLMAELPSIFNWSLAGLDRLRERGHFVQPTSSREAIRELEDLASPMGAFLRDCCEIGPGRSAPVDEMYRAWKRWAAMQGRSQPGTLQTFGRDLRANVPGLSVRRPRLADGSRTREYEGVTLVRAGPRTTPLQPDFESGDEAEQKSSCNAFGRGPARTADQGAS